MHLLTSNLSRTGGYGVLLLALLALGMPAASADITVYINEELMGEHNENTVTVESGQEIKIWIDLTDSHKENVSRLVVIGEYLETTRALITGVASYDEPGINDIPPDYDRYYVKWPGCGSNGYANGILQITISAQQDNGTLLAENIVSVNVVGELAFASIDYISSTSVGRGTPVIIQGHGEFTNFSGNNTGYRWLLDGVEMNRTLYNESSITLMNLSLGDHTVTFQVQSEYGGWSDTVSELLWVGIAPIPKAGIDVEVEPNTEVQFTGSGTDEDGTIVNYEWDLNGDGVYDWSSTLNGITTHIYNGEGTYTAVLRLTDDDGFTATDSRVITVSKAGDGGGGDEGGGIPAPSLAASVAAVAVIALRRRR